MDVVFALEAKVSQLNSGMGYRPVSPHHPSDSRTSSFQLVDHVVASLTLVRKHIHHQRKENKRMFECWTFYLEHLLTFIDTLIAPQIKKSPAGVVSEGQREIMQVS